MTTPPVPSDTDRRAEAEALAAVPDAAVDVAVKLLDLCVAAHASAAANAAELGEPYSAHPISIEGDARAIVASVTPILLAQLQGRLDTAEGQLAKARHRHRAYPDATNPHAYCLYCRTGRKEVGSDFPEYVAWPCPDAIDLGLGEGDGRG